MRSLRAIAVLGVAAVAVAMPAVTHSARTAEHDYVTSTFLVPTTTEEARAFGRDIDGDHRVDDELGAFFATLSDQGLDFAGATQGAVADGDLLMLTALRTPSFRKTRKATWQVFYAKPTQAPDFSGAGSFTVDPNAFRSGRLVARIAKHHVKTAAGTIPVELDFSDGIVTFQLRKAEIVATCTSSGCSNGTITGVIKHRDIENVLLPHLATELTAVVARDCPGPDPSSCVDGSTGKTLQQLFDTNDDLVISTAELQQSSLIKALLAPDIDTNHDHKPDAVSAGFAFGSVKARIVRH